MPTHVALLRGINLGRRRLSNEELSAACRRIGLTDATPYQASGNVLFTSPEDEAALVTLLEEGLERELGYPVATFVRSADELRAVAAARPFDVEEEAASRGKPQVCFLRAAPPRDAVEAVATLATEEDRLAVVGREVHWLPSGGVSETQLAWAAVERVVGEGTTRTRGTVERLARKLG